MAQYYPKPNTSSASNLQFYPSAYGNQAPQGNGGVSGHSTPYQASAGGYGQPGVHGHMSAGVGGTSSGGFSGFGGVEGRVGEQAGLRTGWLAAFGTEGYDGEPPLLEELGVNFRHIKHKTLTVLNPMGRVDQHLMDDSDLAGPMIFFLLFGFLLLLSGNAQFGYIYGLALLGSVSLHSIISLMAPPPNAQDEDPTVNDHGHRRSSYFASSLTFTRSASVLGYCLLPLVLATFVGIFVPLQNLLGYSFVTLAIVWSTTSSSAIFVAVGRLHKMRGLVAYPLALFYVGFGLMSIFSSRPSMGLSDAANVMTGAGTAAAPPPPAGANDGDIMGGQTAPGFGVA